MSSATWPVRVAGTLGLAWGAVLLGRGRSAWGAVEQEPPTPVDQLAIDALGVRHLAQGALQLVAPTRLPRTLVAVDLIHVLTMVPVVVGDPRRRRAAALSAAVALAGAVTTLATGLGGDGER